MTTVDHAVGNGQAQGATRRNTSRRAISQEDLVELVRQLRDDARRLGARIPGRPALAEAIGVKPHRVRAALAELGREQRQARTSGKVLARDERATSEPVQSAPDGARPSGSGEPSGTGQTAERATPMRRPAPPLAPPPGSESATSAAAAVPEARTSTPPVDGHRVPAGARGFYLASVMALLVSMNTSWRFFEYELRITDPLERGVMFAVLEVALLACGWGMRANVRHSGRPGAPRLFAWLLCGISGYMAWQLSGLTVGIARVALGPALGLVMLHLALGIEIRARTTRTTIWARIGRELRERLLSRLGLSDDERDALARTRDRAGRRAARLSVAKSGWFRTTRVARALRTSNVAHDAAARRRMLAELAVIRHAADLATLQLPSPWANAG